MVSLKKTTEKVNGESCPHFLLFITELHQFMRSQGFEIHFRKTTRNQFPVKPESKNNQSTAMKLTSVEQQQQIQQQWSKSRLPPCFFCKEIAYKVDLTCVNKFIYCIHLSVYLFTSSLGFLTLKKLWVAYNENPTYKYKTDQIRSLERIKIWTNLQTDAILKSKTGKDPSRLLVPSLRLFYGASKI